ncbi:hypothetical protein VKT23_005272 [Stygiomarasmius scandens]|uniref:Integral membrane protein n=1 Tax=Marasmiellus scandens TaxID=2682957 RepID=A0ABR1JPK1_9AGAR
MSSRCIFYGIPSILYTTSAIPSSFWLYFWILIGWILQLQCLVQIIVNRICLLIHDPRHRMWLKISMLIWIGLINLGVAIVWIPAQLQINETYMHVNIIFDRIEKCPYLITDAALNGLFIYIVRKRLVGAGLTRFDRLVKFNTTIIWVSLAMDILIICMMSLKNRFLYTIFHPLAYMVKLEIEMTMSNLIVMIATHCDPSTMGHPETSSHNSAEGGRSISGTDPIQVTVSVHTRTDFEDLDASGSFRSHLRPNHPYSSGRRSPAVDDASFDDAKMTTFSTRRSRSRSGREVRQ